MASLGLTSRFVRGKAIAGATIPATSRLFSSAASHHETPQIELEFVSATPGSDGKYQVEKATAESGEKRLRNIMLDNNIDLYASFRKVVNCGGRGLCGTCMVEYCCIQAVIPAWKSYDTIFCMLLQALQRSN